MILAVLLACAAEEQARGVPNGAAGCTDGVDMPVDDDVAAQGMPFAPAELEPLFGGAWTGTLTFADGAADAQIALGPLAGWALRPRSGSAEDGDTCAPSYIVATRLSIEDSSGFLDEDVAVELEAASLWSATLVGTLSVEDVRGTSRPAGWNPDAYDLNRLVVRAFGEPLDVSGHPGGRGTWEVELTWTAWNEDATDTLTERAGEGTFFPGD